MNKELFSVIVLHYNQPSYVFTALSSVLKQNYERIELIFVDDASSDIDKEAIKKYIQENKNANIENVSFLFNEENMGTVKTINRAVKSASGKHILFFAADDALFNKNVITNFNNAFEKADRDVYMISSQCLMMDEELKDVIEPFVHHTQVVSFNRMTSYDQFKLFSSTCFLAIGATAMRKDMFEQFGYFNEEYKFIEDWSYFLHLTRSGGRIQYSDFNGLLHRDGGISHYLSTSSLPPHVLQYKLDLLHIYENEIFPYFKDFGFVEQVNIFEKYKAEKCAYYAGGGTQNLLPPFKLIRTFPRYYLNVIVSPFVNSWVLLIKSIRALTYVSIIYFAAVFSQKALGSTFITNLITVCVGCIFYTMIVASLLILVAIAGLKLLRIIKRCFKG